MPLFISSLYRFFWFRILLTGVLFGSLCMPLQARALNGFDLSDSLLDSQKILSGGPPRDGIPAIDNPRFTDAAAAGWLAPDARVMGVVHNGIAKAYPIAILDWHEIVNDRFGSGPDNALVITYCPLCGTGVVYRAAPAGKTLSFGVSGLLYNSDVLLYDRQTESLWSQLQNRAVTGEYKGQALQMVPSWYTTWQSWQAQYPQTQVLSRETGFNRNYDRSPYGDYDTSTNLYFPVEFLSQAYHPKERVLGLELNGQFKAYPFAELAKTGPSGEIRDTFAKQQLRIRYDAEQRSGRIWLAGTEQELPVVNSFWFAWYTFHPQGEVFNGSDN